MMKSTKYRKHYASKYEFPTRVFKGGTKGSLIVGHKPARQAVEARIGRRLVDPKVRTAGGNWVFMELRNAQS